MKNKVRVYGKIQNRTALGIVNAYLIIHPEATLEELKEAFPKSLNPDSGTKVNFVDIRDIEDSQSENWKAFFNKEDELLHLADGTNVALVSMWTGKSFKKIIAKAAEYGIETKVTNIPGNDSGKKYKLEYLNGFVPTRSEISCQSGSCYNKTSFKTDKTYNQNNIKGKNILSLLFSHFLQTIINIFKGIFTLHIISLYKQFNIKNLSIKKILSSIILLIILIFLTSHFL